ncbi:MAG: iron ABC transporter permease [Gemmatimonadota bacterium]
MTSTRATARGPGSDRRLWPLAAVVVTLLVWLVAYPNIFVLFDSIRAPGGWSFDGYTRFMRSTSERTAVWNSIWISLASVVLSGSIGVPLAFLFSRLEFPGRRVLGALISLPVLLPPLVGVIAFLFLYGETGFLTRSVQLLLRRDEPLWELRGAGAVLLVHAYTMYVYFYLFTSAVLARLDESHAEAAAALGASRLTTLRRVTLPLLMPGIGGAALLVFMTSMASFSAPYVFGGGFRVLTTQIFASKLNGDLRLAAVETVFLAVISILFLLALQKYEKGRGYTGAAKGTAPRARRTPNGPRAWLLTGVAGAIALFLLLPHATVFVVSFVPEGTWTTELFPPVYALDSYRTLFGDRERMRPVFNSFRMASIATVANVILAFAAAYLLARKRAPGKAWIGLLVALPWALPGTVLAMALATTFSAHSPLTGRFVLIGTAWILPLAYFIRNIPLVTRAALASFQQFDPALEEASAALGAGWFRTARRITLPLVIPGLAAGAMLAFVTALGEFVASIMLYTHRTRPISIEILSQLRGFDFGTAAAYAVLLIVLMAIVFAFGQRSVAAGPYGN